MSQSPSVEYQFRPTRMIPAALVCASLEMSQDIPGIHDFMPEPFDITNHAGNMGYGVTVAVGGALVALSKAPAANRERITLDEESMSRFRKFGVAAICGATALVNCITETKWGVQNLPVAEWLGGTTPDMLDTAYSTVWAGVLSSVLFWRKLQV